MQLNETGTKRMLFFCISSSLLGPLVIKSFLHIASFLFMRDELVMETNFWLKENTYNLQRRQRQQIKKWRWNCRVYMLFFESIIIRKSCGSGRRLEYVLKKILWSQEGYGGGQWIAFCTWAEDNFMHRSLSIPFLISLHRINKAS